MNTIYKYELINFKENIIDLPKRAEVVHAGLDCNENLCIWVQLDTEEPKEIRHIFEIIGTGWPLGEDYVYVHIGTIKQDPYIWHIVERFLPWESD